MIILNNNENKEKDKIFYSKEEVIKKFKIEENKMNINNYYVEDNEKYKPTYLLLLTIYYIFLIKIAFTANNWIPFILMISSSIILWLYCLFSIIKNDFKKENQKIVWILIIIFLPFCVILYPDFERIQIIKKEN